MHVCGKKSMNDAGEVWRNLSDSRKSEVQDSVLNFQFPGRGQSEQPVITFPGALKLIMFLPGEAAKQHRSTMVTILQRFFAGDPSMLEDLEANRVSDSPVAQLARASLASEQPTLDDMADRKRKRQLEDEQLLQLKVSNVSLFANTMAMINPDWREDTRLRLQTESWLKNVAFNSGQAAITNGAEAVPVDKSISISQVAQEMGFKLKHSQLIKAGQYAAAKYRDKYDEEPPVHSQWVDGAERKVKSYTERDRGLIVEALADIGYQA